MPGFSPCEAGLIFTHNSPVARNRAGQAIEIALSAGLKPPRSKPQALWAEPPAPAGGLALSARCFSTGGEGREALEMWVMIRRTCLPPLAVIAQPAPGRMMNHPADTRNRLKPVGDGPSLLQQTWRDSREIHFAATDGKQVRLGEAGGVGGGSGVGAALRWVAHRKLG